MTCRILASRPASPRQLSHQEQQGLLANKMLLQVFFLLFWQAEVFSLNSTIDHMISEMLVDPSAVSYTSDQVN